MNITKDEIIDAACRFVEEDLYEDGETKLSSFIAGVYWYKQKLEQCNVSGSLPQVEQSLLDEAVADVIIISTLNEYSVAKKLISEQFLVIDKQDLSGNDR